MVKLSIIIPFYNTYELTCKLLKTLIKQKTKEIEIILVDDGCLEYNLDVFSKDIKVIHKLENTGGGDTCNVGIDNSKGKYIAFIDSDDMVSEDYVSTLIEAIDKNESDVILFNWQDMGNGNIIKHPTNIAVWKAIYKKSIIPRFEKERMIHYDVPFNDKLANTQHSEYYIDKLLYFYNSNRVGNLTWFTEEMRRKEMIKVEAIKDFTLARFDELKNIVRKDNDVEGKLFIGDVFECPRELAEYLTGKNDKGYVVVKIIEVVPEQNVLDNITKVPVEKKVKLAGKPRIAKIKK